MVKNLVISNSMFQMKAAGTAHTEIFASVTRPFSDFSRGPRNKASVGGSSCCQSENCGYCVKTFR